MTTTTSKASSSSPTDIIPGGEDYPLFDVDVEHDPSSSSSSNKPPPPPPHHPTHLVFHPPTIPPPPRSAFPLLPKQSLPPSCLDPHFSQGSPCPPHLDSNNNKFDILWTWVNGSDPHFIDILTKSTKEYNSRKYPSASRPSPKLYRDHDELKHSLRSVLQHFKPFISQFKLVASDFEFPLRELLPSSSTGQKWRLGQIPRWLSRNEGEGWKDGEVDLKFIFQAQLFRRYAGTSFNSYGIESQFVYMDGLTENFIYMNDDFFMLQDLSPSDFYTPTYGHVLRMQPELLVQPSLQPSTSSSPSGEWGPLGYTSHLLSTRFGIRSRPYVSHTAKSLSFPILNEIAHIWESDLLLTASHRFRGVGSDTYLGFLWNHFLVERWREGLVWCWVVGGVGGMDDEWGEEEKMRAWRELRGDVGDLDGGDGGVGKTIPVYTKARETMEDVDNYLEEVEKDSENGGRKRRTGYIFSSQDGYPYGHTLAGIRGAWPNYRPPLAERLLCHINYNRCIAPANSASEAFKLIAFERPVECGDCIIHALRARSGPKGLSAFLPPSSRVLPSGWNAHAREEEPPLTTPLTPDIPHLPLVKDWHEANFALRNVIVAPPTSPEEEGGGGVNIRQWSLKLLERYRFVIGDTPNKFIMMKSSSGIHNELLMLDSDPNVALLCLNDDVTSGFDQADKYVREWLGRKFDSAAKWEEER